MKKQLIVFQLILVSLSLIQAQPGELDPSFNADGKMVYFVGNKNDQARGVAVQPDGKILVTGYTQILSGNYSMALVRYLSDGTPDGTFGDEGKVILNIGDEGTVGYKVIVQPDGRILVGGYTKVGTKFRIALARFHPDGSLDPTFDTDGKLTLSAGPGNTTSYSMALQPDGKIVTAGSYFDNSTGAIAVARCNADGSPDTAFGNDGLVLTYLAQDYSTGRSVDLQSDGKIIVGGYASDDDVKSDFVIVRYLPDGTMDSSYGSGGAIRTHLGPGFNYVQDVAVQPDGKSVAAGYFEQNDKLHLTVLRFTPEGLADNSFGTGGHVITAIGQDDDYAQCLHLLPNGKILVGGASSNGSNYDFALVCYLPDGALDNSFSADGKLTTSLSEEPDFMEGIAVQPDGRIVAVGGSEFGGYDKFGIVRYFGETVPSTATEAAGIIGHARVYPNPLADQSVLEYELSAAETLSVRLYDAGGRCIKTIASPEEQRPGRYSLPLETQDLIPGMYWVSIESTHGGKSVKVVK